MNDEIKVLRHKMNMSQTKFAEYLGIPLPNIQKWEAGRTTPPEYVMKLIVRILKFENPDIEF